MPINIACPGTSLFKDAQYMLSEKKIWGERSVDYNVQVVGIQFKTSGVEFKSEKFTERWVTCNNYLKASAKSNKYVNCNSKGEDKNSDLLWRCFLGKCVARKKSKLQFGWDEHLQKDMGPGEINLRLKNSFAERVLELVERKVVCGRQLRMGFQTPSGDRRLHRKISSENQDREGRRERLGMF